MHPKKIALLTDSCADLTPLLAAENHIYTVPLRILCADGEYADGVNIRGADIYERLRAGELPQTSLPAGDDIGRAIQSIAVEGYDGVIAVMLSSGLSGTYNLVRLIAEECRGRLAVHVFDSLSGSLGQGLTVLQLAEDIRSGMDWEELTQRRVPQLIESTSPFFSVDTLEYLQKGGRIGKVTATAGTLLRRRQRRRRPRSAGPAKWRQGPLGRARREPSDRGASRLRPGIPDPCRRRPASQRPLWASTSRSRIHTAPARPRYPG
ncbi:MAG: DegV family protein [Oscillibacter sp.]|nr:DegV family protein [Oscillibacter sp.]MDD3347605.1 DegV family protein [Oscillibacter sp.]